MLCLVLLGGLACGDGAGPTSGGAIQLRIAGPETAPPGDTVLLAGSANGPVQGVLPASALRWSIGDSEFARGCQASVTMPASGSIVVKLAASDSTGSHADTSHTITVLGPGVLLWRATVPTAAASIVSNPVNSTLLLGSGSNILALSTDPSSRWTYTSSNLSAPAVGADGSVYVGNPLTLAKLDGAGGTLVWTASLSSNIALALDRSGGAVVNDGGNVVVVSPGGSQKSLAQVGIVTTTSFFLDGSGSFWGYSPFIVASVTPQGAVRQINTSCPAGAAFTPANLVPGPQGGVTLLAVTCMVGYSANGVKQWGVVAPSGFTISAAPAVGTDGTLYFGLSSGAVVAIGATGIERWRSTAFAASCPGAITSTGTPALGTGGMIYFHANGHLVAIDGTGATRWMALTVTDTTVAGLCAAAPPVLLTSKGWVFTLTGGTLISAFSAGATADTLAPWGQYLSDEQHTRRAH